jgi:peptidoglycan glycosyltransferase
VTVEGGGPSIGRALLRLSLALILVYVALGAGLSYWQVAEAQRLTSDPANPLSIAASRNAPRGRILDARGVVLASTQRDDAGAQRRRYPEPAAAPFLGYKSLVFGTTGLERTYDAELIGLRDIDPAQQALQKFRPDPYDPADVTLTIDMRLQERAMRLLGDRQGAIVALDPSTGRVLALASTPTYDPQRIIDPDTGRDYFASLREQPPETSALLDRATSGRYTPGSVFKIVTAIAALGSGAVDPDTKYAEQPGAEEEGLRIQGFRVRDGHHRSTGDEELDIYGATEASCNIWYALAGLAVGGEGMLDWAGRLGFGAPIPFELPTATSRVTPGGGPEGGFTDKVELANAAYGQGRTFVTPLQMALVAATVANGGTLMKPHIVSGLRTEDGDTRTIGVDPWRQVLAPDQAGVLRQAMQQAVEGRIGREFAGAAKVRGVLTAGKSGTAELGGGGEPHSWFIGFAPADAPRIAVAVIVERGGAGREQAVPIGGRVMESFLTLAP